MDNLLAKWGDRVVSAGTHRGKQFRDIPAAALRRVSQRCPDRDLYRFARMYAAAEALQDVQPCRPLPALTAARLPLDRLAAVLSRPHTHFLVARLLTRVMQQLLRYAMSLVIHLSSVGGARLPSAGSHGARAVRSNLPGLPRFRGARTGGFVLCFGFRGYCSGLVE